MEWEGWAVAETNGGSTEPGHFWRMLAAWQRYGGGATLGARICLLANESPQSRQAPGLGGPGNVMPGAVVVVQHDPGGLPSGGARQTGDI